MIELIQEIKKIHKELRVEGNTLLLKGNVDEIKMKKIKLLWVGAIKIDAISDANINKKQIITNPNSNNILFG